MVDTRPNDPFNDHIKRTNLLLHSMLSHYLPTELTIHILDLAERWLLAYSTSLHNDSRCRRIAHSEEVIVTTPPLSQEEITNLRTVTFDFRSKDQGWCSDQNGGNWTWFDTVLRNEVNVEDRPRKHFLQHNERAGKEMKDYHIELRKMEQHELFRDLKAGDQIVLMGGAAFPGWVNYVESARLQLWTADNLS